MICDFRTRNTLAMLCAVLLVCALAFGASARDANTATKKKSTASAASTKTQKSSTSKRALSSRSAKTRSASKRRRKSSRVRGQQKIDTQRAQAIQEALIREHYLTGEASGTWDQSSEEAMRRYQRANGWQDKTVPDSRALIKLGLGPSKDHLLNPESAMTTVPDPPKSQPLPTTSHSSSAVANPPQPASPASTPVSSDPSRPQN